MDSAEMLRWLSDDLKDRYAQLERLVESAAWQFVLEDIEGQMTSATAVVMRAESYEQYKYAQGLLDGLTYIVTLRERIDNDFLQIAQRNQEEAEAIQVSEEDFS